MREAEMNEKLQEESEATVHWIETALVLYALKEIGSTRMSVGDLLADYAKKDDTISTNRVASLFRELETIDGTIRKTSVDAVNNVTKRTAERQVKSVASVLATFGGKVPTDEVVRRTIKFVQAGAFADNIPLSQRVWGSSGAITDSLRQQLRAGIVQGESVSKLSKRVKSVYEAEQWQVKRLVVTEANVAQRKVTGESALRSNIVKGVKITDHPGHKNHTKHRCYALAHRDPYGMGMGVYLPTDAEIYSPHPQCTSTLTYVLKDEVKRGA
jgi:hypothetical protein